MARFKTTRKISAVPVIKGLKPFGRISRSADSSQVNLLLEEYEVIRLCDYELLNHHDASIQMRVLRPTFTSVYASVLNKIAIAMVEGRSVFIEGGKVYFDSEWYHCESCSSIFNHPDQQSMIVSCTFCGSDCFHACSDSHYDSGKIDNESLLCMKCNSKL